MNLQLATDLKCRDTAAAKDNRMTNCYAEGDAMVKRPGTTAYATYFGNGQGQYNWNDTLYSIFNDTLIATGGSQYNLSSNYPGQQYQFSQTQGMYTDATSDLTTWTLQTDPGWSRVLGHTLLVFNNKLWRIAGYIGAAAVRQVWSSTDGTTWTQETATATFAARTGHASVVFNGKMWTMGGADGPAGGGLKNDVWYSTDGITWTQATAAAAWSARYGMAAWSYNGKMYVGGGENGAGTKLNDVYYSTDGITWTQATAAAAWSARVYPCYVVYAGKMWIYGGLAGTYTNSVYYSTDGITWTEATAAAAWGARYLSAGVVYNKKMWMIAGNNGSNLNDVYYSTDGVTWTQATAAATFAIRSGHAVQFFNGKVRTIEGSFSGGTAQGSWSSDLNVAGAQVGQVPRMMVKNNNEAFYAEGTTITVTQITDTDYPAQTVPGVVCVDGTFYVMDEAGQIWGSDLETPITWTALNFISSEIEPGLGIVLVKQLNYVYAMKAFSTEVFTDNANATGSPLIRVESAYNDIGCASAGSIAKLDGSLVFMAQTRQRGRQIMHTIGLSPHPISTPYVDRILNADALATVYAWCYKQNGHSFYVLTLTGSSLTLVYDFGSKQWGTATSCTAQTAQAISAGNLTSSGTTATATLTAHGFADGDPVTHAGATQSGYNVTANITKVDANTYTYPVASGLVTPATGSPTAQGFTESYFAYVNYVKYGNLDLVQHETDGKLYQIDQSLLSDNGVYINSKTRVAHPSNNDNWKFYHGVRVIADTVSANAFLRYTDDDFSTYSDYRKIDLSLAKKELKRLDSSKHRAFEFRITDNVAFRAKALDLLVKEAGI